MEVATWSLSGPDHSLAVAGPLAGLHPTLSLGGADSIPAPKAMPPIERPAGLVIGAIATCPSIPATPALLVAAVAGAKDVLVQLSATLEGLGSLVETSGRVRVSTGFLP